jgi:hypothetical protein
MIVGVSLGNMGTVFAQENLREILSSPGLDAFVLPSNQFLLGRAAQSFNAHDELVDERTIGWLEHCFNNFVLYSQTLKPLRSLAEDRTGTSQTRQTVNLIEEGEGWRVEDIVLEFRPEASDVDTGSSQHEDIGSLPPLEPGKSVTVLDGGDGWWIEKIGLNDVITGSSLSAYGHVATVDEQKSEDADTGSSQH